MSYSTKNTGSKIPNEDILAQLRMIAPRNDPKQKDDYDVSDARFAELKIKNTENMIGTTIDEIPDKINSIKLNWVDEQQLYDDVLRDSRCLTRSTPDIIFTRLSEIYKHDIFNCVVRIYKHAPSFFTKTIMNPHQFKAFQKYFMLIEYINFINNTQDDVEISSVKDIDQIRQWVQVRHDNNIQYVINGPNNAGDGYNVKYVDKYNGLMSGSASIDDIAQSQMLTTQQNISSDLNKFLKEFREQHNAYDKLSDEARKYSINISSIKDVRIYKDEDILYFDMRGVDLGEVRDEVTETNYFTAEYEEKREITSMTNTMKLEEIMKFYSRIAIKELIIDPSLYVTNLASLSKVYIVFKGVVANERHISNVFKESDLKIPGHFIRTDRGFEFIPDTDVITYKSQMVNVRNFEMYITTGNPDDKIISNEYALTFDKNSIYNYPVEIYKDNDFSLKMQLLTDEHEEEQIVKYNLHNIEMPYLTTKVIDDLFSGMTGDWSLLLESFIDQWRKVDTKDMIIQNLWTYLGSIFIDVRNAITKKREMEVYKDNDYTSPAEIAVIENATWEDDVKEEMIQTLKQNNRIQYTKLSILTNTFDVIGWKSVVKQLCNIADINWEIMKGTTNQKKIEEGIELLKHVGLSHMTEEEIDNGKNTLYKKQKYIFAKKLSKGWAPINIDGAKWYFSTARDDNNKARLYMTSGTTKLVVANGMKINGNPYNVSKDTYGLKFWKQNDTNGYTWIVNNLEQQVGNANNETVSQYFYSLIGCAENNVKSAVTGYTNTAIDDTEASTTKRDVELAILVWGDVYRALKSMLENISGILKSGVVKKGTLEWKDVDLFYGTIDGKYFTYDNSKGGQYVKFIDYLDNNFRIYTKDQADLCLYNLMTIMNDGSFENNVYGSFMYSEYQQTIQNLKFVYPSSEINQNGALIRYTFDNFYDVDYEDIFGNTESLKLYPIEYTVEDVENKNVDNWYMLEYTQNKHYTSDFDNMTYYIKTNANAIIESMLMEVPVINKMSKIYPLNHVVMLDNDRKILAEFEIFDETVTVNSGNYDVKYENNALCLKSDDEVVYELKLLSQYFEYEDDVWFITFVKDAFMTIGGLILRSVIENENGKNICYMTANDNKTVNIGDSDYNIIVDDTGIMFKKTENDNIVNIVKVELNAKSVCLNEVVYDMKLYDTVNVELHSKVDENPQYYYNIAHKCYIGESPKFDFEYDDKHFDIYIENKRITTSKYYYINDSNVYEYTISANDVNLPDEYISYMPFKTYDSIYDNRPLFEIFGNSLTLQHIINKTNESSKYYEIKAGSRQIKLNLFYYEKVKTEAYTDHAWKLFINRDDTRFEDMELETKLGGHIKIINKGNMFEVDVNIPGMEFNPNKPQEYVTFQESSQDKNYNINVYKVYYNPTDADYTFSDGTVVGKKLLRIDYCVQEKCLVAVCDVLRKEDDFELSMPIWNKSISVQRSDADKKYDIVSYMIDNTWRISTGLAFPLKTDFTNKSDDIYYSVKGSIEQSFDIVIDGSKLQYLVYSDGSVTIGEVGINDIFSWPADAIDEKEKENYLKKLPGKSLYVGSVVDDENGNKVYKDIGLVTLKGNLYYSTSDSYDLNEDDFVQYILGEGEKGEIKWDENGNLYIENQSQTIKLYYSIIEDNKPIRYERAKFINESTSDSINLSSIVPPGDAKIGYPYGIYLTKLGNYKIVNPNNNAPYLINNNGKDWYLPIVNTQERVEFIYQLSTSTELYYRNWQNPSGELITLVDMEKEHVNFKIVIQYVSYSFQYYRPILYINEGDSSNPKKYIINPSYFGTKADISKLPENGIDPKNNFIKIGSKYYILSMIRNNFVLIDRDEKILTLDNVVANSSGSYVEISENSEFQYQIIAPYILYNGDSKQRIDFDIGNGNLSAFAVLDSVKSYMYIYPNNPTYYDPNGNYTLTEGGEISEISGNNLKSKLYVPNVYSNAISISPCTKEGNIIKRIDESENNFMYMLPIEMQNEYILTTTDWKNYVYTNEGSNAKIELSQDNESGLCTGDFNNLVPKDSNNTYVSSGKLQEYEEIKWTDGTAERAVCKARDEGIKIENKYTNDTKLFVHVIYNTININCSETGDKTNYKSFTIDFDNSEQIPDDKNTEDKYIIWKNDEEKVELNGSTDSISTNDSQIINVYHEQLTECAYDENSVYTAYYLYYFGKNNGVHDIISIGSNTYDIERHRYAIVDGVIYIANDNKITIENATYNIDDKTQHVDIDRKPYIIYSSDDVIRFNNMFYIPTDNKYTISSCRYLNYTEKGNNKIYYENDNNELYVDEITFNVKVEEWIYINEYIKLQVLVKSDGTKYIQYIGVEYIVSGETVTINDVAYPVTTRRCVIIDLNRKIYTETNDQHEEYITYDNVTYNVSNDSVTIRDIYYTINSEGKVNIGEAYYDLSNEYTADTVKIVRYGDEVLPVQTGKNEEKYVTYNNINYYVVDNAVTIDDVIITVESVLSIIIGNIPYYANTNNYIIVNGEIICENNGYYIYNFSSYQQSINPLIKKGEEYYIVFDGFIFKDTNGKYNEMNNMYMYVANDITYVPKYVDSVKFDGKEYKILKNNYESMVISNNYVVINSNSITFEINENSYTYSVTYANPNITLSSSESTTEPITFSINDESVTINIDDINYKYYIFVDQHNNVVLAEKYYNISDGLNTISDKRYYIAFDPYSRIIDVSNECVVVDKNTITYADGFAGKNSTSTDPAEVGNWQISYNSSEWVINRSDSTPSWIRYFEYNPHTSKLSNINYINQNQSITFSINDESVTFEINNNSYTYSVNYDNPNITLSSSPESTTESITFSINDESVTININDINYKYSVNYANPNITLSPESITRNKIIPFKQNISDYDNEPSRYNMCIQDSDSDPDYIYTISFDDSTTYNEKSIITPLSFNTYKYTNPKSENNTKPDSEKDSISYPIWSDTGKQYNNQVWQIESIATNADEISLSVIDKNINTDTPTIITNRFYVGDEKTYIYIESTKFYDTFDLSTYSLSLINDTISSQPFNSSKSIYLLPGTVDPVKFDISITKTTSDSFLILNLISKIETDDSSETVEINIINEDHEITSLNNVSLFRNIQYGTNNYLYYIQMIQNELYMTELSKTKTISYDSSTFTVDYDNTDFPFTIEDDNVKYGDKAVAKLGEYFTIFTKDTKKTYYFQITVNEVNNKYVVNIYNVKGQSSKWQWYIMINNSMYEIYIDGESYYLLNDGILYYPKEDESYKIDQNQAPKLYISFENEIGSYYYDDLAEGELIKKNSTIRRSVKMENVKTESVTKTSNICPNLYPFIVGEIEKQYTSPVENIVDVNRVYSDIVSNITEKHKYNYSSGELYNIIYDTAKNEYTFKQTGVIAKQNDGCYIGDTYCIFSNQNDGSIQITYDKSVQTKHGQFILSNDNDESITYYIYGIWNVVQFSTTNCYQIEEDGTVIIGNEKCKVVYNDSQKYVSYDWNEQVNIKNNTIKLQDGEYELSTPKFRVYRETALSTYIQYSESSDNNVNYVIFGYGDNVVYNYISDVGNTTYRFGTINYKGKTIYPYTLKYNNSETNEYTIDNELYTAYIDTAAQMKINETTHIELLDSSNRCQIVSDKEKYNIQYSNNKFMVSWSINEEIRPMYDANITYYRKGATPDDYKKIMYIDRNDYWYNDGTYQNITSGGDNYLNKYDITVTSKSDSNEKYTWSKGVLSPKPTEASIPAIKVDYGVWKQDNESSSTMYAYRLITINVNIGLSNKTFNILAFGPTVDNNNLYYYIVPVTRGSNTKTEKSFTNPGKVIQCPNGTFYITTEGQLVGIIESSEVTIAYTCNISLTKYEKSTNLYHIVPDNFPEDRSDIISHAELLDKHYENESALSEALYSRYYSTDGPISTDQMSKFYWGEDSNGYSIKYSESVKIETTDTREFTFKSNLDDTYPANTSNRTVYIYTALKSVDNTYGNTYISDINKTFTINGYTATWTPDYPYNITTKYSYTRGTKNYDLIRYGDYVELSDGNYYTIIQNVDSWYNNTISINNISYSILYNSDGIHLNNSETDITLEQYSQKTALGETGYSYIYTNHRYEIYDQNSNKIDIISPTFYRLIRNNQHYYIYLSEPVIINTFEYTFYTLDSLLCVYFVKVARIDDDNMVTLLDGTVNKALYAVIVDDQQKPTHLIECSTITTENGQFKINNTTYTFTPSDNEYLVSYNTSEKYDTTTTESFDINGISIKYITSENISSSSLYFTFTSGTTPTKTYTENGYIRFGAYYMYHIINGVMYLSTDGSNISYTFRNNDYGVSVEDNLMNKFTCNNIVINGIIIDNITKTTTLTVGTCTYDLSLITTLKNNSKFTISSNASNTLGTFTYDILSGCIEYVQAIDLGKLNIFNKQYTDSFTIYFKSRVNYDLKITNSLDSTKYYYSYNNLYGNINTPTTIASVNFPCSYSFNISYNTPDAPGLTCTLITYNEIHLIRKAESLSMNVKFKSTEKSLSLKGITSLTEPLIGKPENTYCIKYTSGENKNITCQNPKMNFYIKTESLKTNATLPLFLIEKQVPNKSRALIYSKTYIYNDNIKQATYNSSENQTATIKLNGLSENKEKYLISGTLKLTYDDDPFIGYLVGGLSEKNLNSIISENKSLGVGIGSCTYEYITYHNLKYLYLKKVEITGGYIRYDDGDTITEITPKASSYENLIPSVNERTISHIPIKSIESITPNVNDQICLFEAADVYVYSSLIVNTTSRSVRIINDDKETYIIQKSDDDDNKYSFIDSLNDHYYYESDENILKSQIYKAFIKPSNSILYKYWTRNQYILSVLNSSLNISSPKLVLSDICDVSDSNPLRVDYYTSDGSIIYTFVDEPQEITNLNDSYYIYPDKITDIDGNKLDLNILDISRHKYTIYELNNPATLEETPDIKIQGKYLDGSKLEKDMFTISENSKFPISNYSSHENYDIISFMSSDVITVINNLNSQLGGDAENYIVNCNGVNYVAVIVNDNDNEKYIMYAPQNAENKFIVTKFGNKIYIENININEYIYKQHTEVNGNTYLITLSLNGLSVVLSNPVNDNTTEVSIYLSNNKSIKSVSFSETVNLNNLSMKSSEYTISGTIMSGEYIYADKYSLLIEWENFYNYDNEANVVRNTLYIHGIQLAYNEDDRIRISIDNNTTYLQYVQTPVYCNVPGKYYELQRDDLFKINVSKTKFYKTYPYIRYKQDSFVYPAIKDINNEYIMTISQNAYNSSMSNVYVRSINNISIPNGVNANICNNINPYTTYLSENISDRLIGVGGIFKGNKVISEMAMTSLKGYILPYTGKMQMTVEFN